MSMLERAIADGRATVPLWGHTCGTPCPTCLQVRNDLLSAEVARLTVTVDRLLARLRTGGDEVEG